MIGTLILCALAAVGVCTLLAGGLLWFIWWVDTRATKDAG